MSDRISQPRAYNKHLSERRARSSSNQNFAQNLNQKQESISQMAPDSTIGNKNWKKKAEEYKVSYQNISFKTEEAPHSRIGRNTMNKHLRPSSLQNKKPANVSVSTLNNLPEKIKPYRDHIEKYADHYKVDRHLVAAVIQQESNGNSKAVSHAGAKGLMQLMPGTAKLMGVQNVYDPEQNIAGGVKYLRQMLDKFDGNVTLALAAYNSGPGNVIKYGYKVPPFTETQNYVKSIAQKMENLKFAENNPPPGKKVIWG